MSRNISAALRFCVEDKKNNNRVEDKKDNNRVEDKKDNNRFEDKKDNNRFEDEVQQLALFSNAEYRKGAEPLR